MQRFFLIFNLMISINVLAESKIILNTPGNTVQIKPIDGVVLVDCVKENSCEIENQTMTFNIADGIIVNTSENSRAEVLLEDGQPFIISQNQKIFIQKEKSEFFIKILRIVTSFTTAKELGQKTIELSPTAALGRRD